MMDGYWFMKDYILDYGYWFHGNIGNLDDGDVDGCSLIESSVIFPCSPLDDYTTNHTPSIFDNILVTGVRLLSLIQTSTVVKAVERTSGNINGFGVRNIWHNFWKFIF